MLKNEKGERFCRVFEKDNMPCLFSLHCRRCPFVFWNYSNLTVYPEKAQKFHISIENLRVSNFETVLSY